MGDIDNIVCKLIAMLKGNNVTAATADCDKSELTFETIVTGSTVVSGTSSSGSASNL